VKTGYFLRITGFALIAALLSATPSHAQDQTGFSISVPGTDNSFPAFAPPAPEKEPGKEQVKIIQFPVKVRVKEHPPAPQMAEAKAKPATQEQQNKKPQRHAASAPAPDTPKPAAAIPPVPARRTDIQTASPEFVEKARRTLVDTYTVVKHEGSPMPALPRHDITSENLAPTRLSIADIAHDPLASQIVNLSPEELAMAMNGIKPSSGVVAKTRIVRQEGERIYRSRRNADLSNILPASTTASAPTTPAPSAPVQTVPAAILPAVALPAPPLPDLPAPIAVPKKSPELSSPDMPEGIHFTLDFDPGRTNLSADEAARIDGDLIQTLNTHADHRLQIVAWASPTDGQETSARRTALARALSIRSYLIGKGVDATRMDVRAMGMQPDTKAAADQVDMVLVPAGKS
jgi:outer membrane protein OmpA-like peptidoglycan-associated protein